MIEKKFREIGLSDGEIKVYLALMKNGAMKKTNLAIKAGVSTSKIYEIVSKLMKKGLVSEFLKEKTNYCIAKDPEFLKEYILRKEEEFKREKEVVEELVDELEEFRLNNTDKYSVEFSEGSNSIHNTVIEEVKNSPEDSIVRSFGVRNPDANITRRYHRERNSKNVKLIGIYPSNHEFKGDENAKNVERYKLDISENFGFYLVNGKVVLVSGGEDEVSLVINHPNFYKSFGEIFEYLKSKSKLAK